MQEKKSICASMNVNKVFEEPDIWKRVDDGKLVYAWWDKYS